MSGNKLYPKVNFLLKISGAGLEDNLKYNTDVNSCFANAIITLDRISYDTIECTEVCCDGKIDTIGTFLNYAGSYQINNDTLIISNEYEYYLIRE